MTAPSNFSARDSAQLLAYIRAGGHPHVAAEAVGMTRRQFARWMERGESARPGSRPAEWLRAVRQAQAQARLRAEATVFAERPLDWLRNGPGKERPDETGWTSAPRSVPRPPTPRGALADDPQFQAVVRALLQCLTPHPELRARIADELSAWTDRRQPSRRRRTD